MASDTNIRLHCFPPITRKDVPYQCFHHDNVFNSWNRLTFVHKDRHADDTDSMTIKHYPRLFCFNYMVFNILDGESLYLGIWIPLCASHVASSLKHHEHGHLTMRGDTIKDTLSQKLVSLSKKLSKELILHFWWFLFFEILSVDLT